MVDTIGKNWPVHAQLMVGFTITISVSVYASITDVVFHSPFSVFYQLFHFDQIDSGSVSWTVASSYRQVFWSSFITDTIWGFTFRVGKRRRAGFTKIQ